MQEAKQKREEEEAIAAAKQYRKEKQEDWKDDPKDSPTCNKDSLRLALMVMSSFR